MAIEICPLAADWGSWADIGTVVVAALALGATWLGVVVALLAAAATYWAVVVAMRSSRTAIEEARLIREEGRAARLIADRDVAIARAIVIDHEIYILGGEINRIVHVLSQPGFLDNPTSARKWALGQLPTDPLPMLARFADDLAAFGKGAAGDLLSVLSGWYVNRTLFDEVKYDGQSDDDLRRDLRGVIRSLNTYLDVMRFTRAITSEWATEGQGGLAATDF